MGYAYLFILLIITILVYSFLFLVLNPDPLIDFLKTLASYDLNTIIIGIITIFIAIIALCTELRKSFERKVENQINLIDSLLADLENISSDSSEVYGGEPTKGNLQWYKEQILLKNEMSLDHKINKISYDSYINKLEGNLVRKIEFKKLVRTLSYINDKIREINYHIKELQKINVDMLKKELSDGSVKDENDLKEFLKKTIKYGYFDEIKDSIKSFLEEDIKKKKSRILAKGLIDFVLFNIRISILKNKKVSLERIESLKNLRDKLLEIIDETVVKVSALKNILEKQNAKLHKILYR